MADHSNVDVERRKLSNVGSSVYENCGQVIKEALTTCIAKCQNGSPSFELLKNCINKWLEDRQPQPLKATNERFKTTKTEGRQCLNVTHVNFTVCSYCHSFLCNPVTISCGHTYCKKCVTQKLCTPACVKCGTSLVSVNLSSFKTNVVVADLLKKWWPEQAQAVRLRNEADELFESKKIDEALEKYAISSDLAISNHILESNYSLALLTAGQDIQALQHAEVCIRLRADWPKGYYRKGAALFSLGYYEDAAIAYLQCLTLEPNLPSVIIELTKLFHRILFIKPYWRGSLEGSEVSQQTPAKCGSRFQRDSFWKSRCDPRRSDSSSDEEDTDEGLHKRQRCDIDALSARQANTLYQLLDRCEREMEQVKKIEVATSIPGVEAALLNKIDFECTLCLRTFWQPVTTPCGHVFCRICLDRCLDHQPFCPLCKTSLNDYLAERRQSITEFIEKAMLHFIPDVYEERGRAHDEELSELFNDGSSGQAEIPIFVCTLAFPMVPCCLHIFEPKYRLMIRRCMESGVRKFGMCATDEDSSEPFADYGTVLEIRDVSYFPDGRAIIKTVGRERFRVLQRGIKDGYHTAAIEFLHDHQDATNDVTTLHDATYNDLKIWLANLRSTIKDKIYHYFGPVPEVESDFGQLPYGPSWVWWAVAVLPLDPRAQLTILSMTSLQKRLEAVRRTLSVVKGSPR